MPSTSFVASLPTVRQIEQRDHRARFRRPFYSGRLCFQRPGRALAQAAAVIRAEQPDVVTLDECHNDPTTLASVAT